MPQDMTNTKAKKEMLIIFLYLIAILSRYTAAETQKNLCEYTVCPDYNEYYDNYEDYPDCKTVDPGFEKFEGNFKN